MKRRKVLINIGASLSAGLFLPLLKSCMEKEILPEVNYDGVVAIIGAGASGLYTADSLKTKGVKVRVFEASNRIGGRIRSVTLSDDSLIETDFPLELGADKIYGSESIWASFVKELGAPTIQLPENNSLYFLDGAMISENDIQLDQDFIAAKSFLDNLSSQSSSSSSVLEALTNSGLSSRMFALLNSWIGNHYGSDNQRIGAGALATSIGLQNGDRGQFLLQSNPMYNVLASRFSNIVDDVELNSVIKKIEYGADKIILTGEQKVGETVQPFTIDVDKVVITVPVSVIKAGDLTFSPALPQDKLAALEAMEMDSSVRVILDFKQNFWGSEVSYLYGSENVPEYLSTGLGRSNFNKSLSITVNGKKADQLSAKGHAMIQDILFDLDQVFDGKATQNVRRDEADNILFMIKDWSVDPYIKGANSYVKPGATIQVREQYAAGIDSKIFFAGEATDSKEPGTINGALSSAQRVVVEIVKSIVGA
jgi:monoamine oxidase